MDRNPHAIAKRIFLTAAIYGVCVLLPQYFLETWISRNFPPPITRPEQYYGFIGVALAWQIAFFIIASDVSRYRPLMLSAILEKIAFGMSVIVLFIKDRIDIALLVVGLIDLGFGAAFVMAYYLTGNKSSKDI